MQIHASKTITTTLAILAIPTIRTIIEKSREKAPIAIGQVNTLVTKLAAQCVKNVHAIPAIHHQLPVVALFAILPPAQKVVAIFCIERVVRKIGIDAVGVVDRKLGNCI